MDIFHVVGRGSNLAALELMPDGDINILISAYAYAHDRAFRDRRDLIRAKAKLLLVDSGLISAASAGAPGWIDQQDSVIEVAEQLNADRVVMLDVPMVPQLLHMLGFSTADGRPDFDRALSITARNAESFAKASTRAQKVFVSQGRTLEHRERLQGVYEALGTDSGYWAIGSVKDLTPATGLLDHVEWATGRLRGRIHCLGISSPRTVLQLAKLGIDSIDSSTAAQATRFAKLIVNGGEQSEIVRGGKLDRNLRMQALEFWRNVEGLEYYVQQAILEQEDKRTTSTQTKLF